MSELRDNPLRDLNNARNLPKDTPEKMKIEIVEGDSNLFSEPSDTPETDAKAMDIGMRHFMVDAEFARQLERERNHAWDICEKYCSLAERSINYMDPRYVYREIIRPEFEQLKKETK